MLPSLKRNVAWTFAGNSIYMACQWGILAALTRLGTPGLTGQFAMALAINAPVFVLLNMQLRAVQAADARQRFRFREYRALRLSTIALALAIIAIAAALQGQAAAVVLLAGLWKAVESYSDLLYGLLQRHEKMRRIAASWIARGAGSLAGFVIAFSVTSSLAVAIIALCLSSLAALLACDLPATRLLRPADPAPLQLHRLVRLVKLSFPLGIVMMLISLNTNIPRYFIGSQLGAAELGVFAALAYIPLAGNAVIDAVGQSLAPRLANHFAEGRRASALGLLARGFALAAAVGVLLFAVFFLAGDRLVSLLYRPDYAGRPGLLNILMAGAAIGFMGSILGYGLTSAGAFRVQVLVYGAGLAVNVAACAILIPSVGLSGAAWGLLLANATQCVLAAAALYRAGATVAREVVPARA